MQLDDFLATVVPEGVVVIAQKIERVDGSGKPYPSFSHRCFTTHEAALSGITQWASGKSDVYYALAAYQQGFHPNPKDPTKKVIRVRENVASLKALWLDIDYKGAYPTAEDVLVALKEFCDASGMPLPALIVSSGNGLHLYWPLTEPVPLSLWQRLADAFKEATKALGLQADPVCTADSCRVLRPPGTTNWKDPANPKPVELLYSRDEVFEYSVLESILTPYLGACRKAPQSLTAVVSDEFTGGLGGGHQPSRFDVAITHCAVLKAAQESHGKTATEPEWTSTLQALKYFEDGALWVHAISDHHPGYDAAGTDRKWQARLGNTAGPTLCSTFESFSPKLCGACPHRGYVKTPVQLGVAAGSVAVDELPNGWRVSPDGTGIDRLMIDPTNNAKEWVRALRYEVAHLRATRSILTSKYELQFDVGYQKSKGWSISLPAGTLGNMRRLCETMADYGMVFKGMEAKNFVDLMSTWLAKLQAARRVADVTEQLGWMIDGETVVGFSCGQSTFYADGRVRDDVRAAREFAAISRYYEPKGALSAWKKVAEFLTTQNNPAFTAILAAAFGSPLLRFTGMSGGILSIVSTASGVGKSSALKCSQAVWGSPVHGINAVDDTPKSVARKIGFLNNLPAFWDELRGKKTLEDFTTLAYQITQGKEKTRLDSSAQLREMQTWETMLVVASNESVFDAMARSASGSDAGVVRTFELTVEPFKIDRNRAEVSLLFEHLNSNYGQAGKVYAQHIATHAVEVAARVQELFTQLAQHKHMEAQERFWFAIVAVLLAGAEIAKAIGLVDIDQRELGRYLLSNIDRLRGRSTDIVMLTSPGEIIAAFMQAYQDRCLTVDRFPIGKQSGANYIPDVSFGTPKADKIAYHVSRDQRLVRFPVTEFTNWLIHRNLPPHTIISRLKDETGARPIRCKLGVGTKWELPAQRCFEISLDSVDSNSKALYALTEGGSLRPEDMSDSPSEIPLVS